MTVATGNERGFSLITVVILIAMLTAVLFGYVALTQVELSTTKSSMGSVQGFYAAEAGLNVRAELIRQEFLGYNLPTGSSPEDPTGQLPCESGLDYGSGDFQCLFHGLDERVVRTYVEEAPTNPASIVIPRGEAYQNLHAAEYAYDVFSAAIGPDDRTEAVLEVGFKSRLVPMFQFAAFYDKDLEILPGPDMTLEGPVHANGDLYLGSHGVLTIEGQVTTAGDLYHGRKNTDDCQNGDAQVYDPANPQSLPPCNITDTRRLINDADVAGFNGQIMMHVDELTVPPPEEFDPVPGNLYWDRADLRVVFNLDTGDVEVRDPDNNVEVGTTTDLGNCGSAWSSNSFFNNREGANIRMLEIDMEDLINCIHDDFLLGTTRLDDTTQGGLVFYLTVEGPNSGGLNDYGVRVRNGDTLAADDAGAPDINGLTIVSDQAVYVQGSYNSVDKVPAAVMADSINILSNAWDDLAQDWTQRGASATTVNAAFLAGTDTTGGIEGAGGQGGAYNGGLENYPRFHENWSGVTFTYRGSFVSLDNARHVNGAWVYGSPQYTAPNRNWRYDTDFNDPSALPPLSPRFVLLKQELFVREFAF
jgi:hypothetical protein